MSQSEPTLAVPVSADDHIQGNAAVVTLVEYGDYQCPACAMAYPVVKHIQRHYAGNIRFVFRNFPMAQAHPLAGAAAELAEGAALLDRFWDMHDWLFDNQDDWAADGTPGLQQGLRALSIDEERMARVLRDNDVDARVQRDFLGGVRSGVNGTPGFFVNGDRYDGDLESLARTIGRLIARDG